MTLSHKGFISLSLLIILAKVSGFFKDLSIAYFFGVNESTDAFFLSMFLSSLVYTALYSSISLIVIPKYTLYREKKCTDDEVFSIFFMFILASLILTVFIYCYAEYLVVYLSSSKSLSVNKNATLFLQIMALTFPLSTMVGILNSLQSVRGTFSFVYVTPVFNNLLFCLALVLFHTSLGMLAAVIAGVISWLCVFIFNFKNESLSVNRVFRLLPFIKLKYAHITLFGGAFLFVFIEQINNYIPIYLATMADSGSLTVYSFATKLNLLVLSVTLMLTTTHLMPKLAKCEEPGQLNLFLRELLNIILLLSLPVVVVVTIYSEPIVKIVFLRGDFSSENAKEVALILSIIISAVPLIIIKDIFNRVFFSQSRVLLCVALTFTILIFNILFSYYLFHEFGLSGAATAFVISSFFQMLLLSLFIFGYVGITFLLFIFFTLLKRLFLAVIPALLLLIIDMTLLEFIFAYFTTYLLLLWSIRDAIVIVFFKRIF